MPGFSSFLDWLQAHAIVDSIPDSLLATKVALRGLDADVTEQELDLLEFSACFVAEPSAGPSQIMRRHAIESAF